MRTPRFLRLEAAHLLMGLSVKAEAFPQQASWPVPENWTEDQVEQFFMMFNLHHTRIDEEATKRGHALVSRAVNFKNVGLFLASLLLREANYEYQLEEVQRSLVLALGSDLKSSDISIKESTNASGIIRVSIKPPSTGNDLGSGPEQGNR